MRQIIFRGKRVDKNEFVFGDLIHGVGSKHGRMYILPVTHTYPQGCNNLDGWEVMPETVGQFTGLTDKNGREIYEGDIVSAFSNINKISDPHLSTSDPTYSNKYVEFIRGVFSLSSLEFPNGGCGVLDHYVGAMSKDLEIIGNIHDNPELLQP